MIYTFQTKIKFLLYKIKSNLLAEIERFKFNPTPLELQEFKEKQRICNSCPLKKNNWCSDDRFWNAESNHFIDANMVEHATPYDDRWQTLINGKIYISGCGCNLLLKQIHGSCFRWK